MFSAWPRRTRNKGYPEVLDPGLVGTYPAESGAGGGYVWDAVLEYRVWCSPERGAPEAEEGDGSDYYYVFVSYEQALDYAENNPGTEDPLALILQREHIDEREPGEYRHVTEERMTEWPVEFLRRPARGEDTMVKFFSQNAPANKVDIIRGLADWPQGDIEEQPNSKRNSLTD